MRDRLRLPALTLLAGLLLLTLSALRAAEDPQLPGARRLWCESRIRRLTFALRMYAQDHDDCLPPARAWSTQVLPYIKQAEWWDCPEAGRPYGYAVNSNLDGSDLSTVTRPETVLLLFDSRLPGPNAVGGASTVASPVRHPGGNSFCYLDGHVRWFERPPSFGQRVPPPPPRPRKGSNRSERSPRSPRR